MKGRATEKLNIYGNGCWINHDLCPVYLEVSLNVFQPFTPLLIIQVAVQSQLHMLQKKGN